VTDSLKFIPDSTPSSTQPGLFIAFEGGDGAGKSTQVALLAEALREAGHDVVTTREPGGTDIGEKLRELVLNHGNGVVDARTEALIFAASRAAHAEQLIRPARVAGKIVLCDRYIDSSAAYQGAGRGLGVETVTDLSLWATKNLVPDLTVFIDVPLSDGRNRSGIRGAADRMESEPDEFHRTIHQTFGKLARAGRQNYATVDGTRSIEDVHREILATVLTAMKEKAL